MGPVPDALPRACCGSGVCIASVPLYKGGATAVFSVGDGLGSCAMLTGSRIEGGAPASVLLAAVASCSLGEEGLREGFAEDGLLPCAGAEACHGARSNAAAKRRSQPPRPGAISPSEPSDGAAADAVALVLEGAGNKGTPGFARFKVCPSPLQLLLPPLL